MKQFKTESKRILDLMINSIYTNKEIFLRELISNASDAIDKLHFISLTDDKVDHNFRIYIGRDKDARTLTVDDNGIGMTAEEMEKNLGTIAQSGTLAFKKEQKDPTELIGQFGVGFYSAFMVADEIEVVSRAYGSDKANKWTSRGAEGYTIEPAEKETVGTTITLRLRPKDDDFDYDKLLEEYYLRSLIKKYSDYIRYPIQMLVTKSRVKDNPDKKEGDKDEYESYTEIETINSMTPLWKKKKTEIKPEEYNEFYKAKFRDYTDPLRVMHFSIEGAVNYTAMLFVPAEPPYDYYQKDFKKGLELQCNGVLITDKCEELLPDCFGFMRGVVDSGDLSLNISREMLQHDRQLRAIASSLEKKIVAELKKFMESDRDGYDKFFDKFGLSIKFGVYNDFGMRKEELKDLIEFRSSTENKLVTLAEYVGRMKEDQKFIYFAVGENISSIDNLPQTELLRSKGYEILYCTEEIDEFSLQTLMQYKDKRFCSATNDDLGIENDENKEEEKDSSAILTFVKETLGDKVSEVVASKKLVSHPVCLTAKGGISFEMEKYFNAVQPDSGMKAQRVLELNMNHSAVKAMESAVQTDIEKAKKYAELLYDQALLIAGLPIENPGEYADLVCSLMV